MREITRTELAEALGGGSHGREFKAAQRLMERAGVPRPGPGRGWMATDVIAMLRAGPPAGCQFSTWMWLGPAMRRALDRLMAEDAGPRPQRITRAQLCRALGIARTANESFRHAMRLMEGAGIPAPRHGGGWRPEEVRRWLEAGPPKDLNRQALRWLRPRMATALRTLFGEATPSNATPDGAEPATGSDRSQKPIGNDVSAATDG